MSRNWAATLALFAAIVISLVAVLFSFQQLTANLLVLVAQFLMYSLTLYGFGSVVVELKRIFSKNP